MEGRSEEGRVGRESRSRWSPDHSKKKKTDQGESTRARERRVVLGGAFLVKTEEVTGAAPVLEEETGAFTIPPAATGSGESVLETARIGAELTVVETEAPLTGLVSLESML